MISKSIIPVIALVACFISCKEKPNEEIATQEAPRGKYSCAPQVTDANWYLGENKAPIFEGLDVLDYTISTNSELAQTYFNQGLVLAYGFNHAEAARSFYYATKLDPECAMCFWGYAYVLGPNYNAGMEDDNYERAYDAIKKAKELSASVTEKEQLLIDAMITRYSPEPPDDRSELDINYSNAMAALSEKYPEDVEIQAMFVESIMNLHPWDLYFKDGSAKEWTPEIVTLLEEIIARNPGHPGAHHFYIHAVEASNTPERAYNSAKAFDDGLVPGAGHLVHMPSHVYIRTGDYHKGTVSNINAVKVDSLYVTLCHAQGAYPLAYYPHNYHFMAATATLSGNSEWAIIGANKVSEHVHPEIMKEPGWGTLQHYYVIPYYVLLKLGKWDDVIELNMDTYDLVYPMAVKHYAQGLAKLNTGDDEGAKNELARLKDLSEDPVLDEVTIWDINAVSALTEIAVLVLETEIMATEGNFENAIFNLELAVTLEDALNYDEPPDWFFSVRHHLGAVQIEAGFYEDAITTYEADLERLPKNGWAHHGLKLAYQKLKDTEKAEAMSTLLEESWSNADITLSGSRVK